MKKWSFLLIYAIISVIACKKSDKVKTSLLKDRLLSIQLSDTLNMYTGKTRQVPIVLTPTDYPMDSIKWESSDTSIAAISNTGLLSAKKIGTATISVSNLANTVTAHTLLTIVAPPPVVDSLKLGLIVYYPFNNSTADMSGNGNDGTATNITSTTDRFGNSNAAYYFQNGGGADSSWITVKDKPSLRLYNTDYTINVWVNADQYSSDYGAIIMDKRGHVSSACWALGMTGKRNFYHSITETGVPFLSVSDEGGVPILPAKNQLGIGSWHMITIRYYLSSHNAYIYIDGVLNNMTSKIPPPGTDNNADIYIGKDNPADSGGFYFQGKIDDVRIYNRAISDFQINQLYKLTN